MSNFSNSETAMSFGYISARPTKGFNIQALSFKVTSWGFLFFPLVSAGQTTNVLQLATLAFTSSSFVHSCFQGIIQQLLSWSKFEKKKLNHISKTNSTNTTKTFKTPSLKNQLFHQLQGFQWLFSHHNWKSLDFQPKKIGPAKACSLIKITGPSMLYDYRICLELSQWVLRQLQPNLQSSTVTPIHWTPITLSSRHCMGPWIAAGVGKCEQKSVTIIARLFNLYGPKFKSCQTVCMMTGWVWYMALVSLKFNFWFVYLSFFQTSCFGPWKPSRRKYI